MSTVPRTAEDARVGSPAAHRAAASVIALDVGAGEDGIMSVLHLPERYRDLGVGDIGRRGMPDLRG